MKQWLRLAAVGTLAIGIASNATAGEGEKADAKEVKPAVPPAVAKAFKAAYPTAAIKGTSKETEDGQTVYEVESVDKGRTRDVLYKADGTVIEVEEEVDDAEVPAAVTAAIKARYKNATLTKKEKLTKGGSILFEFALKGADVEEIVLAPDGSWVKPEAAASRPKR